MQWTREGLTSAGFVGFVPFASLPLSTVPDGPGTYVVLVPDARPPQFLYTNTGRAVSGRRHTEPITSLEDAWVSDTEVVYIGKADVGSNGRRGLGKRLDEYRRHGANLGGSHNGGRYLWQLAASDELLVAWREEAEIDARLTETEMLDDFIDQFGKLPFANLANGRGSRHGKKRPARSA